MRQLGRSLVISYNLQCMRNYLRESMHNGTEENSSLSSILWYRYLSWPIARKPALARASDFHLICMYMYIHTQRYKCLNVRFHAFSFLLKYSYNSCNFVFKAFVTPCVRIHTFVYVFVQVCTHILSNSEILPYSRKISYILRKLICRCVYHMVLLYIFVFNIFWETFRNITVED